MIDRGNINVDVLIILTDYWMSSIIWAFRCSSLGTIGVACVGPWLLCTYDMNLQFIRALKSKSVVHTLFWRTGTYIYRLRRQHPQSPNTPEGISMVGTTEGKDLHRGWVIQRDLPTIRSVLAGCNQGKPWTCDRLERARNGEVLIVLVGKLDGSEERRTGGLYKSLGRLLRVWTIEMSRSE